MPDSTIASLPLTELTPIDADFLVIDDGTGAKKMAADKVAVIPAVAAAVSSAVATHAAAADPHTAYALESALGALASQSSVSLTTQATGVLQAAQSPAHTGDVTNTVSTVALTIAADAVTNAKLANVATATIKGRVTAAAGDPEDLSTAQATTLIDLATVGLKGSGPSRSGVATEYLSGTGVYSVPPGGVSDGDKGDITVATGGTVWTIDAGVVSNAKAATVGTNTIKGRVTAAVGAPEDLTPAQAKTVLAIANTDVSGLGALATQATVDLSTQATGVLQAAQHPALTGDVTNAVSTLGTTIAASVVTNAKLANVATSTIKGRVTAAAGVVEDLTPAQAKTVLAITDADVAGFAEAAQDAAGAMVDTTLVYVDATPLLTRAALTGDVTAPQASNATTIAASVVTNAKLANVNTATFKGRTTAAVGAVEDLTTAQATALLDLATIAVKGLAPTLSNVATQYLSGTGVYSVPPGVSDGDKGDVTVATGGTVWTVDAGVVTNAKLANVATATFKGRTTAAAGAPEDLTTAQATALLDLASITVKGLGPTRTGLATQYLDGSGAYSIPIGSGLSDGDKGDITVSVAGTVWTIDAGVVTNAKAATVGTATIKGRVTAATGAPEDLTGTQATTLLDAVTSGLKGLAPASGGGTANFLRADATWVAPPGVPLGNSGEVQYNNAGAFAGAANVEIAAGDLIIIGVAAPAAPVAGAVKVAALPLATLAVPAWVKADGCRMGPFSGQHRFIRSRPGSTTFALGGIGLSNAGTLTSASLAATNRFTRSARNETLVTAAAATAVAGFYNTNQHALTGAAGEGGYIARLVGGPATGVATATNRFFMGMSNSVAVPTDVEPTTIVNSIAMGWDAADVNIQIFTRGAGAVIKTSTGIAVPTADRAHFYELWVYQPPLAAQAAYVTLTDLVTGTVFNHSETVAGNLPLTNVLLNPRIWSSVGGTSSVIGVSINSMELWTDF